MTAFRFMLFFLALLSGCTSSDRLTHDVPVPGEFDQGEADGKQSFAQADPPGLSGPEEWIARVVQERHPKDIELLRELTHQNSGTRNLEGVRAVGATVERELSEMGFASRWVHPNVEEERAGHLVATREGFGVGILMVVHLDTVFEAEEGGKHPFIVDASNLAYGPGVHDMKGGIVVALSALRALHHTSELEHARVTFVAIGDEEMPAMPVSEDRRILTELALEHDFALVFEGHDHAHPGVVTARRGISFWELSVTAQGGHSSVIHSDAIGSGAAYESARILNTLREQVKDPGLTLSIGYGAVGSQLGEVPSGVDVRGKLNRVPELALYKGDLRYLSTESRDRAQAQIHQIVAASLPGTQSTITFTDLYPPMEAGEGNAMLREQLERISIAMGTDKMPAVDPMHRGASDACFTAPIIPTIDGLGPDGGGDHSRGEYVELGDLTPAATRTAILIHRLFQMGC